MNDHSKDEQQHLVACNPPTPSPFAKGRADVFDKFHRVQALLYDAQQQLESLASGASLNRGHQQFVALHVAHIVERIRSGLNDAGYMLGEVPDDDE